jgi:hypothetical protein
MDDETGTGGDGVGLDQQFLFIPTKNRVDTAKAFVRAPKGE